MAITEKSATPQMKVYGSDPTGLVCGYLFSPGKPGRDIGSAEALQWLARPSTETANDFAWLHVNLSNAATTRWLRENFGLSDLFFDALGEGTRSSRIEFADNDLIAVVNDVLYDFSFDASHISTLWMSVDSRLLLSARTRPLRSIDKLRASVRNGETFRTSVALLVHLLRDQADVLMQIVRSSIAQVDDIEDRLLAGRLDQRRGQLGKLRRVLVRLQRLLAPEPAALFRLLNHPPGWMAEADVQELRQSTEEFSGAINDISSLQERIKLLQEEIAAQINEQNNRSLYVLTIVTVLALPINILAGLFGMNVGGVPLAQNPSGFWIVVVIVATFTLGAAWIVFVRARRQ
ncbi:MAG: transporter [Betaproteobacteria bacterium]